MDVLQAAALLREESDRRVADRIAALPEGGAEIRCRAGCHACCHQLVVVSPLEAHALAEYVAERPELARAVAERSAEWRKTIERSPDLAERLERFEAEAGYVEGSEGGLLEVAYWETRTPCPFLEAGRCSVYPVRPFACREHHVVSEPELCGTDLNAPTTAGTRMEYRAVGNWIGTECFGLEDRLVPLPRALEYAAARPGEAAREAPEEAVRAAMAQGQRRARLALAMLGITPLTRPRPE